MTLIARIENICGRAENQRSIEEKAAEVERLQRLLNDARRLEDELGDEVKQLRLLQDQGISMAPPEKAQAARKTLGRLQERFSKDRRAENLTRGRDWTLLKDQVRATCEQLASTLQTEWGHFVQSAYSGDTPSSLKGSLAGTEQNLDNLARYSEVYAALNQYARSRPSERGDFDRVRDFSRQLSEIYQDFDFDVPEAVNRFLRAVAGGGAELELLTSEVRDWLEQHSRSDRYRIVAKADDK